MTSQSLLSVEGLEVVYHTRAGRLPALTDVSFRVQPGEILGVVGESGSGKSTLSAALMRLLPPNGELTKGSVWMQGRDLLTLSAEEMRRMRGRELAMIFQDPLTSLNPTFTIGTQMLDAQRAHRRQVGATRGALRALAAEMLGQVGIPDPEQRLGDFPHQFSGGMRQRIMIATALLLQPALLIADEPTSSLDVTLEAQILTLLDQVRNEHGTAIIFISHDLGVVAQICDRVIVMYAGRPVEEAQVTTLFRDPLHPYTRALLAAVPARERRREPLGTIPGRVPSLSALPAGCKFAERCALVREACQREEPSYVAHDARRVRCAIYDQASGYRDEELRGRRAVSRGPERA